MGHLTGIQILKSSLIRLLFEGIGTMFLTLTFNCTQKLGFQQN